MTLTYLLLLLLLLLFSSRFGLSSQSQHHRLVEKLQEAKLKVAQLESVLDETVRKVNTKRVYLKEHQNDIQELEDRIENLQSVLSSFKGDSSSIDAKINALEEQVKLLWDTSRKNNFDLHVSEAKARDAEDRAEALAKEVEIMSDIVTEQWIEIQQLEQMREFNARRHLRPTRCTFKMLMNDLSEKHLPKFVGFFNIHSRARNSNTKSILLQALQQLKGFWEAVTKYHHELQGLIKHEMEHYKFTAAFANREVVFFLASALVTFPVLGAWMLLAS